MSVFLYLAIVVMWLCVLVPMWLRRDRNTYADQDKDASPYAYEEQGADEDSTNTLAEPLPVSPSTFAASSSSSVSSSVSASFPAEPASGPSSAPEPGEPGTSGDEASESGAGEASPDAGTASEAPSRASGTPGTVSEGGSGTDGAPAGPVRPAMTRAEAERRRAEGRRRARHVAKRRRLTLWCALLLLASVVAAGLQIIPWWGVAPSVVLLGLYLAVLRATVQIDAERRRAAAQAHAERARRARRRAALLETRRPVAEIIDLDAHRDEIFDQYAESPRRAVGD
ncbi:hypothetical protein [Streptosporangium sp. NPDC023615]|uniref:divisome protein SepX/GlpR n=1 Tax=Streptosporangium sp. NPDC023615 TaxID=3154794 RepID=UPI003438FD23